MTSRMTDDPANVTAPTRVDRPGGTPRAESPTLTSRERAPDDDTPATDELLGEVLGNYKLLARIGAGGMGRVYLAEHVKLGRRVAIKLLRPEHAVKRRAVARFFQEAKVVNRIRHRNIVDITDFVELADGTTFIVMELLEGQSLRQYNNSFGPLEQTTMLQIMIHVCSALEAAHAVGVVHRDLKPGNVYVCDDRSSGEWVKLLDFGVAKLIEGADELSGDMAITTGEGAVLGTPAYMSPEQAKGDELDERSDVYALGAIMYELVCGEPVVRAKSFGEYVRKHLEQPVTPPRDTRGGASIDPALETIILRCLAKRREARPQTVREVRVALQQLVSELDSTAVARGHRRRAWAIGGVIALAVAVVATVIMVGRGGGETTDAAGAVSAPDNAAVEPEHPMETRAFRSEDRTAGDAPPAAEDLVIEPDVISDEPEPDVLEPEPVESKPPARRKPRRTTARKKAAATATTAVEPTVAAPAPAADPEPARVARPPKKSGPISPSETKNPFQ